MIRISVKERLSGTKLDDHAQMVVDDFIADLISDCKATPAETPLPSPRLPSGKLRKRKDGIPFRRTGVLVDGLSFRKSSRTGLRSGLLGYVRAPAERFVGRWADHVVRRFRQIISAIHAERGVGWSRSRKGSA